MKKIMFNDDYGLTQAVLEGRKTMTRRMVPLSLYNQTDWKSIEEGNYVAVVDGDGYYHDIRRCGKYQIGEEVAVAMAYKTIYDMLDETESTCSFYDWWLDAYDKVGNGFGPSVTPGWNNKMFVLADLMPNRIRITDIKVERMQDISEEDCLREGIQEYFPYIDRNPNDRVRTFQYFRDGKIRHRMSPAPECFALLIDDICGHGTWERNPWVFAYEFELIK